MSYPPPSDSAEEPPESPSSDAPTAHSDSASIDSLLRRQIDPLAVEHLVARKAQSLTAETADTREQRRSRRKRPVRALTLSTKRLPKKDLELGRLMYPDEAIERPAMRADCIDVPRPCPFVSCKWNLYLDVSPQTGAIKLNFPDVEPDEMVESCALDVADRGGTTLEESADLLNLTRERIRQIESRALTKCARNPRVGRVLAELELHGADGRVHLSLVGDK